MAQKYDNINTTCGISFWAWDTYKKEVPPAICQTLGNLNLCLKARVDPVLWGLKLIPFLGLSSRKTIQNYKYKIKYKREHLFRAPVPEAEASLASQ